MASQKKTSKRKQSLFDRLRIKLNRPSTSDDPQHISPQSQNAVKVTKMVGIGLMKFDEKKSMYTQVRTKSGGGTRNISVTKQSTKQDLLVQAKNIFFPGGGSVKFGPETDYEFNVMDYQFIILNEDITVQEMCDLTRLTNLRFYLAMKKVQDPSTRDPAPGDSSQTDTPDTETRAHSRQQSLEETRQDQPRPPPFEQVQQDQQPWPNFEPQDNQDDWAQATGNRAEQSDDNDELPNILPLHAEINPDSVDIDLLDNFIADLEHQTEHANINHHTIRIHRGHVFKELKEKFKGNTFNLDKDIFNFQMILPNGEMEVAEDNGGVMRDALVEFWDSFFEQCCLGRACKVPFIRHDYGNDDWQAIASVLYFGWKWQNYFPVCIAKSFMSCCIYGMDMFSTTKESLIQEYLAFLPLSEADILKASLEGDFEDDDIVDVLSAHECRVLPTKENLKRLVGEIAHKEMIQQPMYVKGAWFDKLTLLGFSLGEASLESLYESLKPNPRKVMKMLSFPGDMSTQQKGTSDYLRKYVRELEKDSLSRFLRFCTGADLCITDVHGQVKPIYIRFTTVSGLARRPVAHTCGQVLELPEQYENFLDFRTEFNMILESGVWVMDFV